MRDGFAEPSRGQSLRGADRRLADAGGLPAPLFASSRRHERAPDDGAEGPFPRRESARRSGRRERSPRPVPVDRSAPGLQLPGRVAHHELSALGGLLGDGRFRRLRVLPVGARDAPVVFLVYLVCPSSLTAPSPKSSTGSVILVRPAGVAEWQTQGTQNPPLARACRFESGLRHQPSPLLADWSSLWVAARGVSAMGAEEPRAAGAGALRGTRLAVEPLWASREPVRPSGRRSRASSCDGQCSSPYSLILL